MYLYKSLQVILTPYIFIPAPRGELGPMPMSMLPYMEPRATLRNTDLRTKEVLLLRVECKL